MPKSATDRRHTVVFVTAIGAMLELLVTPVAQRLRELGVRCVGVAGGATLSPRPAASFDRIYEIAPFRRQGLRQQARAAVDLRRIVHTERAHLLHLHSPYAIAVGRLVARATGTPHIAVVRGTLFDEANAAGRLFSLVESLSAWLTPTYVTLNADDQRSYRRIAPRSRTHVALCGAAGINYERLGDYAGTLPRQGGRPPRLLVLSRLTPDKNLERAVEAWRLARRSVPDLELRIVGTPAVGEPPWTPPVEPGLVAAGWTDQPGVELAAADVFLSTSRREGFLMSLAEALVVGTPAVAVTNRGSRAIASQVPHGLILVPDDAATIAEAVLRQLRAPRVVLPEETIRAWAPENVIDFHVQRILESLGTGPLPVGRSRGATAVNRT